MRSSPRRLHGSLLRRLGTALCALAWGAGMAITAPATAAQCMGVARTIELDPSRGHSYDGLERSLGLRDGEVVLTFDDGPRPGKTDRILDALRAECTRATFFMAGRSADAYPQLAQRVRREGHTLANHTHAHEKLTEIGSGAMVATIDEGAAAIRRATGVRALPFFRYPYLARSARTDAVLRSKGLIAFGANIDSKDYYKVSPAAVRAKVMGQLRAQRKGIVLMHDIHARTAAMLPALLDQMKAEGFRIVHIVPGRGGTPVADTVLAKAEPRAQATKVVASAEPAEKPSRRRATATLAAFVKPRASRAAPRIDVLGIDVLGGGTIKRALTPAEKRRARQILRREFTVTTDFTGLGGPVMVLRER